MDAPDRSARSNLTSLPTAQLRDRLNRIYDFMRGNRSDSCLNRFDYLWDLKELAVSEGRNTVQIPDTWLEELERVVIDSSNGYGRAH